MSAPATFGGSEGTSQLWISRAISKSRFIVTLSANSRERSSKKRSAAMASKFMSSATFFSERSEEHTSELQSPCNLVCRLLLEKKKKKKTDRMLSTSS